MTDEMCELFTVGALRQAVQQRAPVTAALEPA
jgi:hypothetical protein